MPAGRRGSVERREAQQPSGALRRGGERSLICRLVTLKYDRELSGFPEDALRAELADTSIYQRDAQRAAVLHARDAAIEDELMQALERWEALGAIAG